MTHIATISRVYHFSAAHRLHSPYLNEAENTALYRDCNNLGGHGHNYVLQVTVKGPVDPKTGMILDLGDLDRAVHERVLKRLDHQFIGQREFTKPVGPDAFISTSEAVAYQIWSWLDSAFPAGIRLVRLKLDETGSNHFEYAGEDHPPVAS
jgi:6-pyruvoyltetrahydropterin/6-carboxytetrahydropterin synthase